MINLSKNAMTTVLEACGVPPPADAAAELWLPLSFFDIIWLHFHPIRRLIFYEHPCSKADFLDTLVPRLKQSLSLTLKHYLPVAANFLYPLDTDKRPVIRYVPGDSVPPNALFDPPVSVNYFGNCLGGGRVSVKLKDLAANDGFLIAAEAIVDQIKSKIYKKEEFLSGQDRLLSEMPQYKNMRIFVVSGSPKFHLSKGDFGWGEARKVEILSLDGGKNSNSMSLCNYDGGLLVGLSLPSQRMEAFAAIF